VPLHVPVELGVKARLREERVVRLGLEGGCFLPRHVAIPPTVAVDFGAVQYLLDVGPVDARLVLTDAKSRRERDD
jgi:hypothetical protein